VAVIAESAANPVPVMVSVVPATPVAGDSVSCASTVRLVVAVALSKDASWTTTVWFPFASAGIVKLTAEEPTASVVAPEVIVAVAPPTVTVSAESGAKSWAAIEAVAPAVALVGLSTVADASTVKPAAAELPDASCSASG
jgi:hypothetical protein